MRLSPLHITLVAACAWSELLPLDERSSERIVSAQSPTPRPSAAEETAPTEPRRRWAELMRRRNETFAALKAIQEKLSTASLNESMPLYSQQGELQLKISNVIDPELRRLAGDLYRQEPENAYFAYFAFEQMYHSHRYDEAAAIADRMIRSRQANAYVWRQAAESHFAAHNFAQAERYLEHLKQSGQLDGLGQDLLADCRQYELMWQREQEIREREAAAVGDKKLPRVVLKTDRGEVELELFENEAPYAVNQFVSLVRDGEWTGTKIGGYPGQYIASLSHDPVSQEEPLIPEMPLRGRLLDCECYAPAARQNFRGSVTLTGYGRHAYGSDFRITLRPLRDMIPPRDQRSDFGPPTISAETVCGRVARGMDVVRQLVDGGTIESATVTLKRDHDYERPGQKPKPRKPTLLEACAFSQAVAAARERYEQCVKDHGSEHEESLAALNNLGLAQMAEGGVGQARQSFQDVVDGSRTALPQEHSLTADAMNNLGVALYREGKVEEARNTLQQAHAKREAALGEDHPDTIQTLCNVILLKSAIGDYSIDWDLLVRVQEALSSHIASGAAGNLATSADLVDLRLGGILHPTLEMTFSRPAGSDEDPLVGKVVPRTPEAASLATRLAMICGEYPVLTTAVAIRADVFGREHPQTAMALVNLAATPRFPFGKPHLIDPHPDPTRIQRLQYALDHLRKAAGEEHPLTAAALHNLGVALLSDRRLREQGREHLREADKIVRLRFGYEHPRTAHSLVTMGLAAYVSGDFAIAVDHLRRAHEVRSRVFGRDHVLTAAALNSYGAACFQAGDYEIARQAIEQALAIRSRTLGLGDSETIRSLNDLGVVLRTLGDYVAARQHLESAIEAVRKLPFEEQYDLPTVENNLQVVRLEMGDFVPARRQLERTLADNRDDPFARKRVLANLGTLARLEGRLDEARVHFEAALAIESDNVGFRNDLGAVLREMGDWDAASEHLTKALESRTEAGGEQHPDVGFSLTSLGLLQQRRGKHDEAAAHFEKALAIYRHNYGPRNPRTTDVLRMLGQSALLRGDEATALRYLDEALGNKLYLSETVLPTLAEAEALAYVLAFEERDLLLEVHRRRQDATAGYDVVWRTRALATRAIAARCVPAAVDEQTRRLQAALRGVRRRLARLILAHRLPQYDAPEPDMLAEMLLVLTEEKETLERKLADASKSPPPDGASQGTLPEFLDALPAEVAVIDIVHTRPAAGEDTARSSEERGRYEAFVLTGPHRDDTGGKDKGGVVRVELGSVEPIDAEITRWRRLIQQRSGGTGRGLVEVNEEASPSTRAPQWILRKQVWNKLEPHLASAKTVVVIPEGAFARLPWSALPGKDPQTYLLEDYAVATAAYPQQVFSLLTTPGPKSEPKWLLVGGVDYSGDRGSSEKTDGEFVPVDRGQFGDKWRYLPKTRSEVRAIADLLKTDSVVQLEAAHANETRVAEELPCSRFVHLATHGFFADPKHRSALQAAGRAEEVKPEGDWAIVTDRNPLALSGIVLAGANRPHAENLFGAAIGDDGFLTAEEVTGLNLKETELVVLSACETGLGEVAGGEGVFGLQRAFQLAGARTCVTSLWKVDDAATNALMVRFYQNLSERKMGKLAALHEAQTVLLERYDPHTGRLRDPESRDSATKPRTTDLPPIYWAAFILGGDWR